MCVCHYNSHFYIPGEQKSRNRAIRFRFVYCDSLVVFLFYICLCFIHKKERGKPTYLQPSSRFLSLRLCHIKRHQHVLGVSPAVDVSGADAVFHRSAPDLLLWTSSASTSINHITHPNFTTLRSFHHLSERSTTNRPTATAIGTQPTSSIS